METANPIRIANFWWRARRAARYAEAKGAPGMEFDRYGRRIAGRLLVHGQPRKAFSHLLHPVASIRYLEFPFVLNALPGKVSRCLDVASPRLFSLFYADANPSVRVHMINPDVRDLQTTARMVRALGLKNLTTEAAAVDLLKTRTQTFDCIWSISVIEHISGDYDDREAIRWIYDALVPGGTLILTFMVDRRFHEELRGEDPYGVQPERGDQYFFQRLYDRAAIETRLLEPIGHPAYTARFFGEVRPGLFVAADVRSRQEGLGYTVDDPRQIADEYREYSSWDEMPGIGVCGLRIVKPD